MINSCRERVADLNRDSCVEKKEKKKKKKKKNLSWQLSEWKAIMWLTALREVSHLNYSAVKNYRLTCMSQFVCFFSASLDSWENPSLCEYVHSDMLYPTMQSDFSILLPYWRKEMFIKIGQLLPVKNYRLTQRNFALLGSRGCQFWIKVTYSDRGILAEYFYYKKIEKSFIFESKIKCYWLGQNSWKMSPNFSILFRIF